MVCSVGRHRVATWVVLTLSVFCVVRPARSQDVVQSGDLLLHVDSPAPGATLGRQFHVVGWGMNLRGGEGTSHP